MKQTATTYALLTPFELHRDCPWEVWRDIAHAEEVELTITVSCSGKYRKATRYEPEEWPDIDEWSFTFTDQNGQERDFDESWLTEAVWKHCDRKVDEIEWPSYTEEYGDYLYEQHRDRYL